MRDAVYYVTSAGSGATLPVAYAAKAPQQLWFERDYAFSSMTTLDETNSWRLLLIGLFGIPFFMACWLYRRGQRSKALLA